MSVEARLGSPPQWCPREWSVFGPQAPGEAPAGCFHRGESRGHPRDGLLPTAGVTLPTLPPAERPPAGWGPAGSRQPCGGGRGGGRGPYLPRRAGAEAAPTRLEAVPSLPACLPQPVRAERRHSRARRGAGGAGAAASSRAGSGAHGMSDGGFLLGHRFGKARPAPPLPPSAGPRRAAGGMGLRGRGGRGAGRWGTQGGLRGAPSRAPWGKTGAGQRARGCVPPRGARYGVRGSPRSAAGCARGGRRIGGAWPLVTSGL